MRFVTFYILFVVFTANGQPQAGVKSEIEAVLHDQVMEEAHWALQQQPVTITTQSSSRSAGTKHDFYSEGDYWWPDAANAAAPYVQRDGLTNPDNFVAHRLAMIRFSKIIGALASAYLITGNTRYVKHAQVHLCAWFINRDTFMNPNLNFAQAIKGRATGRGIGIIDTIHLLEVAQGTLVMHRSDAFDTTTFKGIQKWFANYLYWLTTHPYGKEEMNATNNHGTCWVMQVASFATLTGSDSLLNVCRDRYQTVLLPTQMAADGSFPLELKRTKPYGYSLFNLDAMVMICEILSNATHDLWSFQTTDGKSIRKGIAFLFPYIQDKHTWPYSKDIMYWDEWPVAQPALMFGAVAYQNSTWLAAWKQLDHAPKTTEVIRNFPVRHPLLWIHN